MRRLQRVGILHDDAQFVNNNRVQVSVLQINVLDLGIAHTEDVDVLQHRHLFLVQNCWLNPCVSLGQEVII